MRCKFWKVLAIPFALLGLLALGCGEGAKKAADVSDTTPAVDFGNDSAGNANVGAKVCINCHADFSWSDEIVAAYRESKHFNHSDHVNADSGPVCLGCHDPVGDGETLASGLAAVTCEACHGGGGKHFGAGPMPVPQPDFDVCGKCHNSGTSGVGHDPFHPFGSALVENYKAGGHFTRALADVQEEGTAVRARCSMCHTDQGFQLYAAGASGLGRKALRDVFFVGKPDLESPDKIQCRTCHDPHSGDLRAKEELATEDSDGNEVVDEDENPIEARAFSASFKLCTSCHQVFLKYTWDADAQKFAYSLDPDVYAPGSGTYADLGEYHNSDSEQVIADTHFAGTFKGSAVAGYNINAGDEKACLLCHDAHGATKFEQSFAGGIAEEWGNTDGFHGDYLDFAYEEEGECAKCHSGTEFVKLTLGQSAEGLSADQSRVIACVSCHDLQAKGEGGAFELGALRTFKNMDGTPAANFSFPSGKTLPYAAIGENALCMTCHSGRESKASVDAQLAAEDPDGDGTANTTAGTFSRPPSLHYRPAGATLFGNMAQGLYEFAGKTYAAKFEHVASNDLCVECHNVHSGELYFTSPGFGPTGCDECHEGVESVDDVRQIRMTGSLEDFDGDGNVAEGLYGEVTTLRDQLWEALQASGVTGTTSRPTNLTTPAQVRAWYNMDLIRRDPGAYAHNGAYVIELLVDSLEVMGRTTNSVTHAPFVRDSAGHFDAAGLPFRDWDADGAVPTSCSKCHSSEGAAYFFDTGTTITTYERKYTNGISSGLACESCHTAPFDGDRRPVASVTFPSGTAVADEAFAANDSTLCMTCHQGRAWKGTVDGATASGTPPTYRFTNIHYFAAAASFFGSEVQGGYEYTGQTYAGRMTFPADHNEAGFTTCTGCHMADGPSHDFKPNVNTCGDCHGFVPGGEEFKDLNVLNTNYNDIQALKDQLKGLIEASGVSVLDGYPYFSNITTKRQLQACYNWQVADKEPCGYIHNPDYTRQLLYDSIVDMGGTPVVARPGSDT